MNAYTRSLLHHAEAARQLARICTLDSQDREQTRTDAGCQIPTYETDDLV